MALSETIKAGPTAGRLDHIPGHMGMPIFGSTFEFLRDPFAFHQIRLNVSDIVDKNIALTIGITAVQNIHNLSLKHI